MLDSPKSCTERMYIELIHKLDPSDPHTLTKILSTRKFPLDDVLTGQGASGGVEIEFTNQGTGLDWKSGVPVSVVYKPSVTVYLNLEGRIRSNRKAEENQ